MLTLLDKWVNHQFHYSSLRLVTRLLFWRLWTASMHLRAQRPLEWPKKPWATLLRASPQKASRSTQNALNVTQAQVAWRLSHGNTSQRKTINTPLESILKGGRKQFLALVLDIMLTASTMGILGLRFVRNPLFFMGSFIFKIILTLLSNPFFQLV